MNTQAPEDYPAHNLLSGCKYPRNAIGMEVTCFTRECINSLQNEFQTLLDHNLSLRAVMGGLVEALEQSVIRFDQINRYIRTHPEMYLSVDAVLDQAKLALSRANQSNSKR